MSNYKCKKALVVGGRHVMGLAVAQPLIAGGA